MTMGAASTASMTGSARGRLGGDAGGTGTMGPRAPNGPKRRPLPSDPVTGQPPAQPLPEAPAPFAAPLPVPPVQQAMPIVEPQQQAHEYMQTPPRPQPNPPSAYTLSQSPLPAVNYNGTPPQLLLHQQKEYQLSQTQPPGGQAPLTRHASYQDQDPYMSSPNGAYESTPPVAQLQQQHHHRHQSRHSHHSHHSHQSRPSHGVRDFGTEIYEEQQQLYDPQQDPRDLLFDNASTYPQPAPMAPSYDDSGFASQIDERPPPPPVHRSLNDNSNVPTTDALFRSSLDSSPQKITPPPTMRRDVLRNEAHRHSASAVYPGRPVYRPLETNTAPSTSTGGQPYQLSPPHYLSYDSAQAGQNGSEFDGMSDTSGTHPAPSLRGSTSRPPLPQPAQPYQDQPEYDYGALGFDKVPSPAPLNVGAHRASFSATSPAPTYSPVTPTHHRQNDSNNYVRASPSPIASNEYSRTSPSPQLGVANNASYNGFDPRDDPYRTNGTEQESARYGSSSEAYMLPPVPASLVPGVDPSLALELRSRIHQEERYSDQQQQQQQQQQQRRYTLPPESMAEPMSKATPPRGRQMMDGAPSPGGFDYESTSQAYTLPRPQVPEAYSTPSHQPRYDTGSGPYSSGAPSPAVGVNPRGASPNPRQTIKRKSISPAPPSATGPAGGEKRLSGIPFGPDSYDALNPAVAASKDKVRPDYNESSGMIISHDGREIDPSDHLPVESWAPEPEPKPSNPGSAATSPAAFSTPVSGRKQLRVAGRPQTSTGSSGVTFSSADDPGTTYTPTSRNRLQKKSNRQSVAAVPVSSGALSSGSPQGPSSPLAPLTHPRQQQDNFTPPRNLARASTFDFPSENHAPSMYGSSPGRASFGGPAPPIPAKVPISASTSSTSGGGGVGGSPYGSASHTGSYRGSGSYGGGHVVDYTDDGGRSPVMSGALQYSGPAARALPWDNNSAAPIIGGSSSDMALVEELSRIDIGTGRARRHQGRHY